MSGIETLTIERLGHRGEGIATFDDKPVFVPLTLEGETVAAAIEGYRGRLVEIVSPSPKRVEPFCPHYGACGGCQLQHLEAEHYRQFKRGLIVDALSRADVEATVADPITAHGAGRRRVTMHATKSAAGFMALRSHAIHDVDTCPILVPPLARAPEISRAIATVVGPCDVSLTASDTGLDVAIRAKGARAGAPLTKIAQRFDLARLSLNGEPLILLRRPMVAMGQSNVPLPVSSFLQATARAEEVLASLVIEAVRGGKQVADLFCGVGPFALRLAASAPLFAADSDIHAIDALDTARRNTKGSNP